MNKIYYNQADPRWANHPYPSKNHPKATIKSGGCGATCGAMIVSSIKQTIYPNEMGDLFIKNHYRALEGTDANAFYWISNNYNIPMRKTIYINDAIECLKKGGMVIAHLYNPKKSLFSTGGHYIVLADIKGNDIVCYDPYLYSGKFNSGKRRKVKVSGVNCIISKFNFKLYNDYILYCFEAPKEVNSKYKVGEDVEINVPIALTGAKEKSQIGSGEDVMVDDGSNQFWVHESLIQNNHIIARVKICFVCEKEYMVQVFNRQFWVIEKNITKKLS